MGKDWNTIKADFNNANGFRGKIGSLLTPASQNSAFNADELTRLRNFSEGLKSISNAENEGAAVASLYKKEIGGCREAVVDAAIGIRQGTATIEDFEVAQKAATKSSIGLNLATIALNVGMSLLVSGIIAAINYGLHYYDNIAQKAEEATGNLKELNSTIQEQNSKMADISAEYVELSKGVNTLGENVSLTTDEYNRYHQITNEIADMFPTLVQGYDDTGNAILRTKGSLDDLTKSYKENQKAEANRFISENQKDVEKGWKLANKNDSKHEFVGQALYVGGRNSSRLHTLDILSELNNSADDIKKFQQIVDDLHWWEKNDVGLFAFEISQDNFSKVLQDISTQYLEAKSEIDNLVNQQKELARAYLLSNDKYESFDSNTSSIASSLINSITSDTVETWKDNGGINGFVSLVVEELQTNQSFKEAAQKMLTLKQEDLPIEDMKQQIDIYISKLAETLGMDENILKIQFGFEDFDETYKKYENALNYIKDNFSSSDGKRGFTGKEAGKDETDFFKANSINTDKEIDKFLELAKSSETALEAEQKYLDWLKKQDVTDLGIFNSENFDKEIDNIQSIYSTLTNAIKEYNKYGAYSLDTLQSLLALKPEYIAALVDENGKLTLNEEALKNLLQIQLKETKAKLLNSMVNEINALSAETNGQQIENEAESLDKETEALKSNTQEAINNALTRGVSKENIQGILSKYQVLFDTFDKLGGNLSNVALGFEQTNSNLEKLKSGIEDCSLVIDEFDSKLELLDMQLDFIDEDAFSDRAEIIEKQLSLVTDKGAALKSEFNKLASITPQTADEADTIASRMESIGDALRSNLSKYVSLTKELSKARVDALVDSMVDMPNLDYLTSAFDSEINRIERTVKALKGESLFGDISVFSAIMPEKPEKSELQKQQDLHSAEIAELEEYENEVLRIKREALDLQQQENQTALSQERDNLIEHYEGLTDTVVANAEDTLSSWLDGMQSQMDSNPLEIPIIIEAQNHLKQFGSFKPEGNKSSTFQWNDFNGTAQHTVQDAMNFFPNAGLLFRKNGGVVNSGNEYSIIGEKGQESAVLPNGKFVLLGQNGAELVDLPKGTRVFTAEQTADILKYTGGKINGEVIPHYADGNVNGNVSFNVNDSVDEKNTYLKLKANEISYLQELSKVLSKINSSRVGIGVDSSNNVRNLFINKFSKDVADSIKAGFNSDEIDFSTLNANSLDDTNSIEDIQNSFKENLDEISNAFLLHMSDWDNIPQEIQNKLFEIGANKGNWTNWIQTEDNVQSALKVFNDGGVDTWDALSKNVVNVLSQLGIDGKQAWDNVISNNPLQAFGLMVDTWQTMTDSVSSWVLTAYNIVVSGLEAIRALKVEAPSIAEESWANLEYLIIDKIQEILQHINQTFQDNAVNLNFKINNPYSQNSNSNYQKGRKGIVETALSQVGSKDYAKYGSVNNTSNPNAWCNDFVSWCAVQAGLGDVIPLGSSTLNTASRFGINYHPKGTYQPQPGDIVYYNWQGGTSPKDHVGIFVGFNSDGTLHTVEGNTSGGTVAERNRSWDSIVGFGTYAKGGVTGDEDIALVGEYGREIAILPNGQIQILGQNSAELVDLPNGTKILNNQDAKQVLKYTGTGINGAKVSAYSEGTSDVVVSKGEVNDKTSLALEELNDNLKSNTEATNKNTAVESQTLSDWVETQKDRASLNNETSFDAFNKYINDYTAGQKEISSLIEGFLGSDNASDRQGAYSRAVDLANEAYKKNLLDIYDIEKITILHNADIAKETREKIVSGWNEVYAKYNEANSNGSYEEAEAYYEKLQEINDALNETENWMDSIDDDWQSLLDSINDFYADMNEYVKNAYGVPLSLNDKAIEDAELSYSRQDRDKTRLMALSNVNKLYYERLGIIDSTLKKQQEVEDSFASQFPEIYEKFTSDEILAWFNPIDGSTTNAFADLVKVIEQSGDFDFASTLKLYGQVASESKKTILETEKEKQDIVNKMYDNDRDLFQHFLDHSLQVADNILSVHKTIISSLQKEEELLNRQMNWTSKFSEKQKISQSTIDNLHTQEQEQVNLGAEMQRELDKLYSNPKFSDIISMFDTSKWVDANGERTGYFYNDINDISKITNKEQYENANAFIELLEFFAQSKREAEQSVGDIQDRIKSAVDEMYQQQVDAVNSAINKIIEMIEKRKERELKALEQVHEKRTEQLQEEAELVQDIYDRATNLLDDVKSEEDYEKELFDEQKIADNLQAQIDQYALDDSDASFQKKIELQKQLNEQIEKINELQRNHEYEQTKKALSEDLETYNKYFDELQEAEDEHYEYNQQLIEARYTQDAMYAEAYKILQSGIFEDFTAKGVYTYEQIYNKGNQVALALTAAYDDFATETGEKFTELGVVFNDMLSLLEDNITLIDIFKSKTVGDWNLDTNSSYAERTGNDYYNVGVGATNSNMGSNNLKNGQEFTADEQFAIEQMRKNSDAWWWADEEGRNRLHAENQKLAKQIGALWDDSEGYYYRIINGKKVRLYHSGRIANSSKYDYNEIDNFLGDNEEFAIIRPNENIITNEKMHEWAKNISLFGNFSAYNSIPTNVIDGLHSFDRSVSQSTTNINKAEDNSININRLTIGAGNNITKADVKEGLGEFATAVLQ